MSPRDTLGAWALDLGHSPSLTSRLLVFVLPVGAQYFRDDVGVLQGGGVPQILSFVRDDLPQEPPHDFSRPSFWKTFHYLARKGRIVRISGDARIPSQRPTALR